MSQRSLRFMAPREPGIEHWLCKVFAPVLVEQVRDGIKVEDKVTDGDARAAPTLADRKDPERQVLDREVAALGAFDPAGHGSFALGKPVHAWS